MTSRPRGVRTSVRARLSFFLVVVGLVFATLLASPATAHAEKTHDFPTRWMVNAGAVYGFAAGDRADYDSFQYLTFGVAFDHAWGQFRVETPAPFIVIDGIAALIGFMSGGWDTVPIFEALNGEEMPGRLRFFQIDVSGRPYHSGPHGLEIGLLGHFDLVSAYVDGMRHGQGIFHLGPTVGYVFSNQDALFRVYATGGNGFGNDHAFNPYVGFGTTADFPIDGGIAFKLAFDLTAQRIDLRDDEGLYPDAFRDVIEWTSFGTTIIGFGGMF